MMKLQDLQNIQNMLEAGTEDFAQAAAFLRDCQDVHILIHKNPDGDCIGAGFSLQAVLQQMGKRAAVICCDAIPQRFHFLMPETECPAFQPKHIISVDIADEKLLGSIREDYAGKIQLCIDHHVSNQSYAQITLLRADAAAACEVLYALYRYMQIPLTEQIARCLYTGMATDTGCFRFANTTPETHLFTAELMQAFPEIPYARINRNLFEVKSPSRIQAELFMLNQMEYHFENRCTMVWVTLELCRTHQVKECDMEGLTSLSLQPEGVEIGVTFREREPGIYKVSMRSAGELDVSVICQKFGGGGHVKAAGCELKGTEAEVRNRILEVLGEYLSGTSGECKNSGI